MAELFAPFAGEGAGELAQRLIGHFGSLERVLSASIPQLREAAGGFDDALLAIHGARRLVDAALDEELAGATVDSSDPALQRYLRARIGGAADERLHVIYSDRSGGYLADEQLAAGSGARIEARARPLVERAIALGAAGFLLAHNHPSGDCRPSADDRATTRKIAAIAAALELSLLDHLIVTRRHIYSMRAGARL